MQSLVRQRVNLFFYGGFGFIHTGLGGGAYIGGLLLHRLHCICSSLHLSSISSLCFALSVPRSLFASELYFDLFSLIRASEPWTKWKRAVWNFGCLDFESRVVFSILGTISTDIKRYRSEDTWRTPRMHVATDSRRLGSTPSLVDVGGTCRINAFFFSFKRERV